MKYIATALTSMVALFALVSCSKDHISPEELLKDSSKVAKTTILTRSGENEEKVIEFRDVAVYRKSDRGGQSWFTANSGGKMVYDMFMLSIYFDSIDKMNVGQTLKPSSSLFMFPASSDSNSSTHSYDGMITLSDKGDDYVIFHFHHVSFSCSLGKYTIDGYLYCPLLEEFEIPE